MSGEGILPADRGFGAAVWPLNAGLVARLRAASDKWSLNPALEADIVIAADALESCIEAAAQVAEKEAASADGGELWIARRIADGIRALTSTNKKAGASGPAGSARDIPHDRPAPPPPGANPAEAPPSEAAPSHNPASSAPPPILPIGGGDFYEGSGFVDGGGGSFTSNVND